MHEHGGSRTVLLDPRTRRTTPRSRPGRRRWGRKGDRPRGTRPRQVSSGRSAGQGASSALDRVREVAVRDKDARFTALLHHVDLARLRKAYAAIRREAAPGQARVHREGGDGRQRPLGIASLEDKIVQRAVVEVLNAVYEVDFRGFSDGFRPGRRPARCVGRPRRSGSRSGSG